MVALVRKTRLFGASLVQLQLRPLDRYVIDAKWQRGLSKRWIAGSRRHRGLFKFPGDAAGEGSCTRQSDWIVSHTCHSR